MRGLDFASRRRNIGYAMRLTILLLLACAARADNPKAVHIFVRDMSSHDVSVATASGAEHASASSESGQAWGSYHGYASSGNYPQMPETARDFMSSCPDLVVVTTDPDRADYMFLIDHQRFKNLLKHNKVVLVNRAGDVVWADQTRLVPNAVKDACEFLKKSAK